MFPETIPNWLNGQEVFARSGACFEKINPHTGARLCYVARSLSPDVDDAVTAAKQAQPAWAAVPPVRRSHILHAIAMGLRDQRETVARIVALETGKSYPSA